MDQVGRYNSPDEHPFFPIGLPEPMLPPMQYPQVTMARKKKIAVSSFWLLTLLFRFFFLISCCLLQVKYHGSRNLQPGTPSRGGLDQYKQQSVEHVL